MAYTLVTTDTGVVLTECDFDWNDADTVPPGTTLYRDYILDANGERLSGPRRVVDGVVVAVDNDYEAREKEKYQKIITKDSYKNDKFIQNAILKATRLASNASMAAIESNLRIALIEMRSVINKSLPSDAKISANDWTTVVSAFKNALDSGNLSDDRVNELWENAVDNLSDDDI